MSKNRQILVLSASGWAPAEISRVVGVPLAAVELVLRSPLALSEVAKLKATKT